MSSHKESPSSRARIMPWELKLEFGADYYQEPLGAFPNIRNYDFHNIFSVSKHNETTSK